MAKLNQIIQDLNHEDYENVFKSLIEGNAEKSAHLLRYLKENSLKDNEIMAELKVNSNAYYTLRSRLNQRIEEYLLQKMESPRADLLKKVANIHEVISTQKRAIAIATLKKLERELLDYDLSNELTIVYKYLKKLHLHSEDHFNYKQLYNQHVAFNLALDEAEDSLGAYFSKYGEYYLTDNQSIQVELDLLAEKLNNTRTLYKSHRLFVYQNCQTLFTDIFVAEKLNFENLKERFEKLEVIFETYYLDSTYYHLKGLIEALKFSANIKAGNLEQAELYADEVSDYLPQLVMNFQSFTFPAVILNLYLDWYYNRGEIENLANWNRENFSDYEPDVQNIPGIVTYYSYRALTDFLAGKYEDSSASINQLLNEISFKSYPVTLMDLKLFLAIIYAAMDDYELFSQLAHSIQRQIRILGKENAQHAVFLIKYLKSYFSGAKKNRKEKLLEFYNQSKEALPNYYTPVSTLFSTGALANTFH